MKRILAVIVFAQFFGTSLWFAGNAILPDLIRNYHLPESILAQLTSAVQFGFIAGTLVYAVLSIADRFSPSKVFFISSLLASLSSVVIVLIPLTNGLLLASRFLTGFFLAGIYPVGMKIASDYFDKGLGKSMGFLLGALVLGTAFPHLIKAFTLGLSWNYVVYTTATLATLGGIAILLFVPDGPHRKQGTGLRLTTFLSSFRKVQVRSAAYGYFGHMWELYAYWAFVPVILQTCMRSHPEQDINISLISFFIIASGSIGCVAGGYVSQKFGERNTAAAFLFVSFICCLLIPFILLYGSVVMVCILMFIWGFTVIPDSPLYSTMVAIHSDPQIKGTTLTIMNSIGFFITIVSIQLLSVLHINFDSVFIYSVLAVGPAAGLVALLKKRPEEQVRT